MLVEENKNPVSYSMEDYRANLKKQIQILGAMLYSNADELIDKCKSPLCFDDYQLKLEACLTKCGRPVLILQTLKPSYDICSSFSMSKWVEEVQEERKKSNVKEETKEAEEKTV